MQIIANKMKRTTTTTQPIVAALLFAEKTLDNVCPCHNVCTRSLILSSYLSAEEIQVKARKALAIGNKEIRGVISEKLRMIALELYDSSLDYKSGVPDNLVRRLKGLESGPLTPK